MAPADRRVADDCVAARLTPRGRGAVATIRIHGDLARLSESAPVPFAAASGTPLARLELDRVHFGHWGHKVPEEVVVCRHATDCYEIHCHGGDAASNRILDDLKSAGCRIADWNELDVSVAPVARDIAAALMRATTLRTAGILLEQQGGRLASAFDALKRNPNGDAAWPDSDRRQYAQQVDELLNWANFGMHLSQPYRVVLAGRPNAGKSSLINALMGFSRAIVFDEPGTTRDTIACETALDGWPVELCDTAGLRESVDRLEAAGIERTRERIAHADCLVLVCDRSRPPEHDDLALMTAYPRSVVVAHKCDLPDAWRERMPADALPVSSLTNEGVDALASRIVETLVPTVPSRETPVPVVRRQIELLHEMREAAHRRDAIRYDAAFAKLIGGVAGAL